MKNQDARKDLGEKPIDSLLLKLSVPAAIGILTIMVYNVVDTIFVGRWVQGFGIAAVGVVGPITMLIASVGMAIGMGGASIISRALGAGKDEHAYHTFGNLVVLTIILSAIAVSLGFIFETSILQAFGAKGEIYPYASAYYRIILIGLPFLAFSMMSNNVIRAEGKAKVAMMTMVIPGILNIGLDPIFILTLDMGIEGAATATVIAYFCSASFAAWFFLSGRSSVVLRASYLRLDPGIVRETFAIGITTFARQATASLLSIAANNMLFRHGGENAITSFTIIQRVLMIAFVPLFGLVQGFLPISGYNYGAGKFARLKEVTIKSMAYGVFISTILFVLIISFANSIVQVFTTDAELINATVRPLRIVFFATPVIGIQLVGAAYFQALGRAIPALILTLMRQAIFLIPLVLILPRFFELDGIWYAFPIAELLAMLFTSAYMWPQWNWLNNKIEH